MKINDLKKHTLEEVFEKSDIVKQTIISNDTGVILKIILELSPPHDKEKENSDDIEFKK